MELFGLFKYLNLQMFINSFQEKLQLIQACTHNMSNDINNIEFGQDLNPCVLFYEKFEKLARNPKSLIENPCWEFWEWFLLTFTIFSFFF